MICDDPERQHVKLALAGLQVRERKSPLDPVVTVLAEAEDPGVAFGGSGFLNSTTTPAIGSLVPNRTPILERMQSVTGIAAGRKTADKTATRVENRFTARLSLRGDGGVCPPNSNFRIGGQTPPSPVW